MRGLRASGFVAAGVIASFFTGVASVIASLFAGTGVFTGVSAGFATVTLTGVVFVAGGSCALVSGVVAGSRNVLLCIFVLKKVDQHNAPPC
ncbi:MAG: hypothetical protein WD603_02985 [Patescibacteria group bacterium]